MLKNVLINSSPRRVIISSSISSSSSSASSVEKNEHFSFVEARKRTDLEIERFQKNVALLCPTDCGKCCSSPNVEASEGEMRLVAERLEGDGLAEFYFGKLESSRTMKRCVFFTPISEDGYSKGKCAVYEQRPAMCRLFGFSGRKDKNNKVEFVGCEHQDRLDVSRAKKLVADGTVDVPIASTLSMAIRNEAGGDDRLVPINEASYDALAKVLFMKQFQIND